MAQKPMPVSTLVHTTVLSLLSRDKDIGSYLNLGRASVLCIPVIELWTSCSIFRIVNGCRPFSEKHILKVFEICL